MAAFATFAEAEERAKAKIADKTWIVAHAQRNMNGQIGVRFIRNQSLTADPAGGAWVETTDNAAV